MNIDELPISYYLPCMHRSHTFSNVIIQHGNFTHKWKILELGRTLFTNIFQSTVANIKAEMFLSKYKLLKVTYSAPRKCFSYPVTITVYGFYRLTY